MRGSAFCYFHGRAPRPARPARTLESNIEIPLLNSHREIVGALNRIMQALAANRISSRRAAVLLQAVQMASGQPLLGSDDADDPLEDFLCPRFEPEANHMKE